MTTTGPQRRVGFEDDERLNPLGKSSFRMTLLHLFDVDVDNRRPAVQNFEYKVSCILDKPTESMFGYISVLVCRLLGIAGLLF